MAGPFADFTVGLAHGGQRSDEKHAAMDGFATGRTDLLVATTVVEVGIDVQNATTIVVEGPTGSGSRSSTSCAAGSGAASTRASACSSASRRRRRGPPARGPDPDQRRLPPRRAGPRDPR